MTKKHIVILGAGFGGIYCAMQLEKLIARREDVEVTLVNKENFFLFTPMLHEVAASDLSPTHIVSPIQKLLKCTNFFCGNVDSLDTKRKIVTLSHGNEHHSHQVPYDHLVLSLGSVTHFYNLPGLEENALTMRTLGDALSLRNRVIAMMEEANFECCKAIRSRLLTFVVAGSGFAGVETVAAINDFIHETLPIYRNLKAEDIRIELISSSKVVLPELSASLGIYTGKLLSKRGVKIRFGTKVTSFQNNQATFADGSSLECCTLIWTAGNAPNPMLTLVSCKKEKGRVLVNDTMEVAELEGIWALGDCAAVPNGSDGFHPPTAQHACRQGIVLAKNIISKIDGKKLKTFRFKMLGQLASLGRRSGVAEVFGMRFNGFIAWWLWRSIYLMKLPRIERKCRVALDWTLDLLFSKDTTQIPILRSTVGQVKEGSLPIEIKAAL